MTDLKPFLKSLMRLPGVSGYESPVRDAIRAEWQPLVDELTVSPIGSLHGLKRGAGENPPRLMLSTHMDAIGLMVTGITPGGFLRIFRVGGVDPRILPGMPVAIQTQTGALAGVIAAPVDRLLPASARGKPVRLEHLLIDTGLPEADVRQKVRVGDEVAFDTQPLELSGDTLVGHTLDNRASVAAVTECLRQLQGVPHAWDVVAAATVQEEETLGGALTSPYSIAPQLAIAIDVTHAKGPGASDWRTAPLGEGITLDWGPNTHPLLFESLRDAADALEVPYSVSVYPSGSGTDAMGLQIVGEGIPTAVISLPLRYMHTPVELISLKDVARCARLLAGWISRLQPEFLDKLTSWE